MQRRSLILTTILGITAGNIWGTGFPIKDPLAESSAGAWELYEGPLKTGRATVAFSPDHVTLGGAMALKTGLDDMEAGFRVQFMAPASPKEWECSSLTLFDENGIGRVYLMVMFSRPGMAAGTAELSLFTVNQGEHQSQQSPKPMKAGAWYQLAAECSQGKVCFKVWPVDSPEPENWDVQASLGEDLDSMNRVGLRTFGGEELFRDFQVSPRTTPAFPNANLSGKEIRACLRRNGTIRTLEVKCGDGWEAVKFRSDILSGPKWGDVRMERVAGTAPCFTGTANGVRHTLRYEMQGNRLAIIASLKNEGPNDYAPKAARLVMGIDSLLSPYPIWNERYFPTLLRCEKTHFWGYLMTPKGRIMTVGSPDPVASYAINYEHSIWGSGDGGQWLYTFSLDLLHALPLPPRHPQNLVSLKPGEERTWTIYLQPASSIEEIKPILAASLSAPMIDADRYTVAAGESSRLTIQSPKPVSVVVTGPDGSTAPLPVAAGDKTTTQAIFTPKAGPGLYSVTVTGSDGHQSEAFISMRQPWSWYMNQARRESLHHKQYASSHLEQWLGLETGVLARWHLPDPDLDAQSDQRLKEILKLQWDLDKKVPTNIPHSYRLVPNTAQMAGVLAYRYMADHDPYWLDLASGFADYVAANQIFHYVSVFYPLKSVMTVMAAEKQAMGKDNRYQASYDRHYAFVKKFTDELVKAGDNLKTEGPEGFENGMISCAGTELGLFALLQKDPKDRHDYAEAALKIMTAHRCLEQLQIPDSRMNGATLRFWEAQYDTLIGKSMNMMDSPHGWSAWVIPGLWYQYLLTGEEEWLRKAMNAMGSCAQLIDSKTGELRWAFVPDPYREVSMLEPNSDNPMRGKRVERIIGEQYIPMIAAFHYPDHEPISGNADNIGWTCCNDVHEVFIALEEVALTSAYVLERGDGELVTWNCTATRDASGTLCIQPFEDVVSRVHLNLRKPYQVSAKFANGPEVSVKADGMQWIGPGGTPELLR